MARGGINKALVQKARRALLERGEHPSIDAVRIELGNTGSKSTIHRYLKELEEAEAGQGAQPKALSSQLNDLVAELAARLEEEAQASVAQQREQLAQERAGYLQRLEQAQARIRQLEGEGASLAAQLQETRETLREEQQQLQQARIECARVHQANQDLGARLADRDAQVLSLEDKHRHAREALEHYRQASKEQREQEQCRHEAQVQQLQMEIRQLQQSLIVKQDELTRLNRDNERFVTEARQARKEQAEQQASLERQGQELTILASRLALAESGREVQQARANDLQAEVTRLADTLAVQHRQAELLQASLSEMASQMSRLQQPPAAVGSIAEATPAPAVQAPQDGAADPVGETVTPKPLP